MAVDFARNLLCSIGQEATYNTYISTGHQAFTVLPGSRLSFERDIREEMSARGKAAPSPHDMASGLRRWGFDCSMNMPKEALGHWLYYTFGAIVTTTITGYRKHVISVNDPALGTDATPPSFSLRLMDDNREWNLSGGHVSRLQLVMALDNFWRVNATVIGGTYVDAALGSPPSPTAPASGRHYLTSDDFAFKINTSGAANWAASNFEVTFERNYAEGAEESYQSGSAERARLVSAGTPTFNVTGSTRRLYDGITQFDLFDAYTQFRVEAATTVVAGENLVALNSDGYYFGLMLEKCYLTNWEKTDAGGITLQKLDFRGTYDTAATDIQVTTQDTLATPATAGTP